MNRANQATKRVALTLRTSNKDAASRRAVALYNDILHRGLDAVIVERKTMFKNGDEEAPILTIGTGSNLRAKSSQESQQRFGDTRMRSD